MYKIKSVSVQTCTGYSVFSIHMKKNLRIDKRSSIKCVYVLHSILIVSYVRTYTVPHTYEVMYKLLAE